MDMDFHKRKYPWFSNKPSESMPVFSIERLDFSFMGLLFFIFRKKNNMIMNILTYKEIF